MKLYVTKLDHVTIEVPGNENSGGKDLDFGLLSSVAGDFEVMQGDRQAARRSKVYGCGTDAAVACPGASHGTHAGYWRCNEEGTVGHAC